MEFIQSLVSGPVLPASLLVAVMACWSLLGVLGAIELDFPTGDVELDVDADLEMQAGGEAVGQLHPADGYGLLFLRWLNIHEVPIMVWLGVFAITWWTISITTWLFVDSRFLPEPGWLWTMLLIAKNLLLAAPLTKLLTAPMRSWFRAEMIGARSLLGQECEISSLQANPDFGQVRFKTEGAPLLLNVRTDGPHLARGARVWITHYDAKRRVYIVSPTGTQAE